MSKFRAYCFTINNYTDQNIDELRRYASLPGCRYITWGKETAPTTGTKHLQGYLYHASGTTIRALSKKITGAHWEQARGSPEQNRDYCHKDFDFEEYGELPNQGKRTDLKQLAEKILSGGLTVQQIRQEDPGSYHHYGRTLEKLEDDYARKLRRTTQTRGTWIHGPTGTGKSHRAFDGFDPGSHYVHPLDDKGWWDGYTGQRIVILEDFRGELPYNQLLRILDKYPYSVPRRSRQPIPFVAEQVIITSSLSPQEVYHRRNDQDSIEQLLRRIEVVHLTERYNE